MTDAYLIERELGGGGMSRVFLAEERALGRKVVIKALPPEITAALSADRFRREVQLAASLQHPHIVPVLASGEADGILWYSMPHVEGRSLRTLLDRDGALPATTVVRLLQDIADALEHAHGRGVVHRDIKPENILLSGNHAVVTDFGIAKAVATARRETGAGATTEGLVIGTPAYMAPEQAAGDPHLDQRADLYALGAVGYEMLAGAPVFVRPTPQALIAAHITEAPPPLDRVTTGVPGQLSQLIMFCLAKDPARRPSASAVRTTLETLGPSAVTSRRRRLGLTIAAAIVLLGITSAATGFWPRRSLVSRGLFEGRDRILVADVANRTGDSTLGPALTQALRVDLTQSDIMRVVNDQEIGAALARMQRDPGTGLSDTLSRELAQREGIKAVVAAEVAPVGSGYVLSARILAPADGSVLAAVRENARNDGELLEALGKLSHELRRRTGESLRSIAATAPLERVSTGSLDALRKYSQGIRALDFQRDFERGRALLGEAIALDSGFAMAWRKLGIQLNNEGRRAAAVTALTAAFRNRDRLAGTERTWTEASYFANVTFENARGIAAYQAILEADSLETRAMNNLAILHQRVGSAERAEVLFRKALAIDTTRLSLWTNLLGALIEQGKVPAADSLLGRAGSRLRDDPIGSLAGVGVRYAQGGPEAADSAMVALTRVHTQAPWMMPVRLELQAALADLQGHHRDAVRFYAEERRRSLAMGALEPYFDAVTNEAAVVITNGRKESGIRLMEQALEEHPFEELDLLDRPYLDFAYVYAIADELDKARAMLAEFAKIPLEMRRGDDPYYRSVLAMIALSERRWTDALASLDAIGWSVECRSCVPAEKAWIWDRAGQPDSAMHYYEVFLRAGDSDRMWSDRFYLPGALFRLGELHEGAGNRVQALEYFGRFVELWRSADQDLQPRVAEARARIAALTEEP